LAADSGSSGLEIRYQWDKSALAARDAAAFAGRVIVRDPSYISHGEIQTGLACDAIRWDPSLAERYAEDFLSLGEDRDLLVARDSEETIVGFAIVAWEETSRRRFAVLEDMAVDPARRAQGIGAALIRLVEARVRERQRTWLFLESGLGNTSAHHLFERQGFSMISYVFGKQVY